MTITMTTVKSSNIRAVGYDTTRRTMRVQFHNGAMWDYHDVPPEVHAHWLKADSIGGHFSKNVRNKFKGAQHKAAKQ